MNALRSGFRAVLRQPALILAEIAWRWSFGAAAWVLLLLSVRRILAGIDISEAEYLLARRSDVFLIADACARVLYQALPAITHLAPILILALAAIWVLAATLGRAATLTALTHASQMGFVGPGAPAGAGADVTEKYVAVAAPGRRGRSFSSLLLLNVLRAVFTLATLLAFLGTMILAGVAFPAQGAGPAAAAVIWVILAALAALFWTVINWFLALAPIWIVRDGQGPFRALAGSIALFRRDSGVYVATGWWFGFIRGLALLAAFLVALFAASAVGNTRAAAAASLLIALLYFAVSDFLFLARLAAYAEMAGESPRPSAVSIPPFAPEPQPLTTSES